MHGRFWHCTVLLLRRQKCIFINGQDVLRKLMQVFMLHLGQWAKEGIKNIALQLHQWAKQALAMKESEIPIMHLQQRATNLQAINKIYYLRFQHYILIRGQQILAKNKKSMT
jgi:hypothetical protein